MNKREPKIRFKGFTDEWEQHKLGDVSDIVGGGTPSTKIFSYWGGKIDWYSPVEIGEQIYVSGSQSKITELGLQKSSTHILPVGTVLFTSRAGIGKTAILKKEGTTNQGFQSIIPHKNELDSYFVYSITNELKRYGETNGSGSTFLEVSGKQMAKMPLILPEIKEQRKISGFIRNIDNLITARQKQLDLLKELKKGFLQKMFPKAGEAVPELRFAGFADDWEKHRLNEMVKSLESGTSVNSSAEITGYYVLKTSAIKSGCVDLTEVKSIVQAELKRAKSPIKRNSIIISRMNTPELVGASGLLTEARKNTFLPDRLWQGEVSKNFNAEWLIQTLNTLFNVHEIQSLATGTSGSMKNISKSSMLNLELKAPKLNEQEKIGVFFKYLNNAIAFNQRQLISLQELKKGFLQQMFI